MNKQDIRGRQPRPARQVTSAVLGFFCAITILHDSDASAYGASLSRSVEVDAPPSAVWSVIGPFCSIKDWHPAIGTCSEEGANPPTRRLVTKDGKTTFVEPQMARSDVDRFYSYTFESSPFPVTHYMGTIWVVSAANGGSTVFWTGTYTPEPGKEKEAHAAFAGVYEAGLAALKTRFTH
jgi:hypothetical protein